MGSGAARPIGILLVVLGVVELATGALLWLAPGFFFDRIGPYGGVRNDHYMGDLAGWYLALGAVALVAARRPSWRVPVLVTITLQFALHTVSHVIDVGDSNPAWHGPLDAAVLGATTVLLSWVTAVAARQRG